MSEDARSEASRIDFERLAAFRRELDELASKLHLLIYRFDIEERDDRTPDITIGLYQLRRNQ